MAYQLKFQLFFSEKCQADFKIYMEMSGTKNSQDSFAEQDLTYVSCIAGRFLPSEPSGKPKNKPGGLILFKYVKCF